MATELQVGPLLAVGRTAEVYAWGADKVLKLYFAGIPAAWCAREAASAGIAAAAHLPAPALYGTLEMDGRHGLIFERVQGPSMLEALLAQPTAGVELARLFAQVHAGLHAGSAPQLTPLKQYVAAAIGRARGLSDTLAAAALARLEQLPDGAALCHFDFHPSNIILAERGPVVIDWATVVAGSPDADVARTVFLLGMSQLPPEISGEQRARIEQVRGEFLAVYLESYRSLRPCPPEAIEAWLPVLAAARLAEDIPGEEERLLALAGGLLQ